MNRADSIVRLMLFTILAAPVAGLAQEWTRFRGPNGSGLSDSEFPAKPTEANIAWNIKLPGGGHSSPVVWGDKVFVTCADDSSALRMVVCLSAKTGAIEWKKEYGSHTYKDKHVDNSYASSTPAVDAERVYVCWSTPEEFTLVALKHDGVEAGWKVNLGSRSSSQHGSGNSPDRRGRSGSFWRRSGQKVQARAVCMGSTPRLARSFGKRREERELFRRHSCHLPPEIRRGHGDLFQPGRRTDRR